jgi:hypothetical protein
MERVQNHAPAGARFYHRSKSPADEIAGHSTVVNALKKVDINLLKAGPNELLPPAGPPRRKSRLKAT